MPRVANGHVQNIRTNTRRKAPQQELHIVRDLAPQPKLFSALGLLVQTTGNLVQYKDPAEYPDNLHVTVMILGRVLRQAFGVGPGQCVPAECMRQVKADLTERFKDAGDKAYQIGLHDPVSWPLALYGRRGRYVGICLNLRDPGRKRDRAIVATYFKEVHGISGNAMQRSAPPLRPHVTIGAPRYGEMIEDQVDALKINPSDFLLGAARARQERLVEFEGQERVVPILFPDGVDLLGAQVLCQPRRS